MNPSISLQTWPVVYVKLPTELTEAKLREIIVDLFSLLGREEAFTAIVDTTDSGLLNPSFAGMVSKEIDKCRDDLRKYLSGVGLVVTSPAMRGALNAIVLVVKAPYPTRTFTEVGEARAYCLKQLAGLKQRSA